MVDYQVLQDTDNQASPMCLVEGERRYLHEGRRQKFARGTVKTKQHYSVYAKTTVVVFMLIVLEGVKQKIICTHWYAVMETCVACFTKQTAVYFAIMISLSGR